MQVLLVSTYELGHQPLALASAAAALRVEGHKVRCLDLAVEATNGAVLAQAELIANSIPTVLPPAWVSPSPWRARLLNPAAHICFFGLYAAPLRDHLVGQGIADSIVEGDTERLLPALSRRRWRPACRSRTACPRALHPCACSSAACSCYRTAPGCRRWMSTPVPGTAMNCAWPVTSRRRAAAHRCTHCPLTTVFGGRLRLVAAETVLADIEQQVESGARHITFGDPESRTPCRTRSQSWRRCTAAGRR